MNKKTEDILQWIAGRSAGVMFFLSVAFLAATACLVVLWVDMPNLQERASDPASGELLVDPIHKSKYLLGLESIVLWTMTLVWPVVLAESVLHWCTRPWSKQTRLYHWFDFFICLCPPLRMCARSYEMGNRLWLPGLGWRKADRRLRRRLERQFSVPMIVIALMIMPILITEFFLKDQVAKYAWLRFLLHTGTGIIWFAFAFEFVLMVSVAKSKIAYCKKHFVDIAIILLPFVSFLRSLRVLRASSLANVLRFPQLTKMARAYRLRGTAIKVLQSLILLDVFQRFARKDPTRRIDKLTMRLEDVEREAKMLRREISQLQRKKAEMELEAAEAEKDEDTLFDVDAKNHDSESNQGRETIMPTDVASVQTDAQPTSGSSAETSG